MKARHVTEERMQLVVYMESVGAERDGYFGG